MIPCFERLRSFFKRLVNFFRNHFVPFHFKNWRKIDKNLVLFRTISILILIGCSIVDTLIYSTASSEKSLFLKFSHGSQYIAIEVAVIIYTSGLAAFGLSIEVYLLLIHAIVNAKLAAQNCDGSNLTTSESFWVVKLAFMFLAVELCCRNLRQRPSYDEHFNSSARAMLKQALIFSGTMVVPNLSGLRAIYHTTYMKLPDGCVYEKRKCGIVTLYDPKFPYGEDICFEHLIAHVGGREIIRILRDFMLLHMFSYSVFNRNFFQIKSGVRYRKLRIFLVLLFVGLISTVVVSNINPFIFVDQCRLAYAIIEIILFLIICSLMGFNLWFVLNRDSEIVFCLLNSNSCPVKCLKNFLDIDQTQQEDEMDKSPTILPQV